MGRRVARLLAPAAILTALGAGAATAAPQTDATAYENMPTIPPIGARKGKYLDVPEQAKGPPIDPARGYRIQDLGRGLYMVTDNAYQSMFLVYEGGVVVVDTPPSYAAHLRQAITEITDKPITYLIYSHAHVDHIGGAAVVGGHPVIIAQEETKRLLERANDQRRPLPTVTFKDRYTLKVGSQVLELSYHGVAHEPGNIFIYAPAQRVLMAVDLVSPGWMPFKRFSFAQNLPGYFDQVAEIDALPWETLVGGHVARTGTHADVRTQLDFMSDVRTAVEAALRVTKPGVQLDPASAANPWAVADNYTDRVVLQCVNSMGDKWSKRLGGYDAFIWDQCYAMEQSVTMD